MEGHERCWSESDQTLSPCPRCLCLLFEDTAHAALRAPPTCSAAGGKLAPGRHHVQEGLVSFGSIIAEGLSGQHGAAAPEEQCSAAFGKGPYDELTSLQLTMERGRTLCATSLPLEHTLSTRRGCTNGLLLLSFGVHD